MINIPAQDLNDFNDLYKSYQGNLEKLQLMLNYMALKKLNDIDNALTQLQQTSTNIEEFMSKLAKMSG